MAETQLPTLKVVRESNFEDIEVTRICADGSLEVAVLKSLMYDATTIRYRDDAGTDLSNSDMLQMFHLYITETVGEL